MLLRIVADDARLVVLHRHDVGVVNRIALNYAVYYTRSLSSGMNYIITCRWRMCGQHLL